MAAVVIVDAPAAGRARDAAAVAAAACRAAETTGATRVWCPTSLRAAGLDETAVAATVAASLPVRVGVGCDAGDHLLWLARRLGTVALLSGDRLDVLWDARGGVSGLLWLRACWRHPTAASELGVQPVCAPGGEPQVWLLEAPSRLAVELGAGRVEAGTATGPDGDEVELIRASEVGRR